jgi:hypothetical protein
MPEDIIVTASGPYEHVAGPTLDQMHAASPEVIAFLAGRGISSVYAPAARPEGEAETEPTATPVLGDLLGPGNTLRFETVAGPSLADFIAAPPGVAKWLIDNQVPGLARVTVTVISPPAQLLSSH